MKVIKSTGKPQEDAKLVSEESGLKNFESREKAEARAAKSSSFQHRGNSLVETPHLAGETIMVVNDGNEKNTSVQEAAKRFDDVSKKIESNLNKPETETVVKSETTSVK